MSDPGPPAHGQHASIPLIDLRRQHQDILADARATFERVAAGGRFSLGDELAGFEDDFARYCGSAHCVGVSDGTRALALSLTALGVRAGDRVLTVAHTFVGTVEAIALAGAQPVLVDIDAGTRCMSTAGLEAALDSGVSAVIPVHLYGRPAPMRQILELSDAAGVPVLEDAAQAHGARCDGRPVGSIGRAGAFSFYPTKNLGAFGDGGAVVTDDEDVAAAVRSLRHHGCAADDANRHVMIGETARLDELQAALLRLKLPLLDEWNSARRNAAELYRQALAGLPVGMPPDDPDDGTQVFHLFVVEVDRRDEVLRALRSAGIGAAVHYPAPVHLQPAWKWLGHSPGDFPAAEALSRRALSLPLFPGIGEPEIARVAEALESALA